MSPLAPRVSEWDVAITENGLFEVCKYSNRAGSVLFIQYSSFCSDSDTSVQLCHLLCAQILMDMGNQSFVMNL